MRHVHYPTWPLLLQSLQATPFEMIQRHPVVTKFTQNLHKITATRPNRTNGKTWYNTPNGVRTMIGVTLCRIVTVRRHGAARRANCLSVLVVVASQVHSIRPLLSLGRATLHRCMWKNSVSLPRNFLILDVWLLFIRVLETIAETYWGCRVIRLRFEWGRWEYYRTLARFCYSVRCWRICLPSSTA